MPRGNPKYTAADLEERLEDLDPKLIDRLPPESAFGFWSDKNGRVWLKIGKSRLLDDAPISVRLFDDNVNDLMHSINGIPEKLIHKNKEFSRLEIKFSKPFNYLSSSDEDTLQWSVELRVMTMFIFTWCEKRDHFVNFRRRKERAFDILVEILERIPQKGASGSKKRSSNRDGDDAENIDSGSCEPGSGDETKEEASACKDVVQSGHQLEPSNGIGGTISASVDRGIGPSDSSDTVKKRSHDDFLEGQKD
ncbi:hypothetical protein N0V90_003597 [Kalmusia sp. IMI 367209]|nr:hypothetical protein N0V90_003597 [Kalmusia sp. IMI 367209]